MPAKFASDLEISITRYSESDADVLCEADADPEHRKRFDFPDDYVTSIEHAKSVIASWNREFELKTPVCVCGEKCKERGVAWRL